MRIGIDAKWYLSGNPSGLVVVKNLVSQIIRLERNSELFLFVQDKDREKAKELELICSLNNNVTIVYCLSSINFLSNLFIIPFYAKHYKVEVVLLQNYTPFLFYNSIRYVTYVHDFLFLDYSMYYSAVENIIFRLMPSTLKFADEVITISESEKRRIVKHSNFPANKIHVVYHGISDDFSPANKCNEIKQELFLPKDYLLYLGRINIRKNIGIILYALSKLPKEIKLVVVGKKDHKTFDIDSKIRELGLSERVILTGHLDYRQLLQVIASAKLFVFPSFAEGFGLPPLEAMKSGVPVVVSNATCLPEVCGSAATYFSPDDENELVNVLTNMWDNSIACLEYSEKGIEHVKQFKWDSAAIEIMQILKKQHV